MTKKTRPVSARRSRAVGLRSRATRGRASTLNSVDRRSSTPPPVLLHDPGRISRDRVLAHKR